MASAIVITCAVEGVIDDAVAQKLIVNAGCSPGKIYGREGKAHLRQRIRAFNNAARLSPWFVLADLDQDAACAPDLRTAWLSDPAEHLCFRIAVREVEAWLLGDQERVAKFLGLPVARIPAQPELLDDPKLTMVNLARKSRRKDIRIDMIPSQESGRQVGPAYTSRLIEFVSHWRPDVASECCESLRRAMACLARFATMA